MLRCSFPWFTIPPTSLFFLLHYSYFTILPPASLFLHLSPLLLLCCSFSYFASYSSVLCHSSYFTWFLLHVLFCCCSLGLLLPIMLCYCSYFGVTLCLATTFTSLLLLFRCCVVCDHSSTLSWFLALLSTSLPFVVSLLFNASLLPCVN